MCKCAALLLVFVTSNWGQNCIHYGAPTTLAGRLLVRDESGYNQFIALQLPHPICTAPDSREGLEWEHGEGGVQQIQAGFYGSDGASERLRERLERLAGYQVRIEGVLFTAQSGYHRTAVQLGVEAVEAVDAAGQRALRTPPAKFHPKEVAAYDVTINAARRLVITAQDSASKVPLTQAEKYAPHWMTGGELVYVDCLDGYERKLISTTEKNGGICFDGDLCGFSAFSKKPVIIRFRCTKKP